jgi:hypothetical protein
MTNAEAIIEMQLLKKAYCNTHTDAQLKKNREVIVAYDLAIKALEQEPCDCISRAKAQKHIYTRLYESALNNVGYECKASDIFTDIAENRLSTWISEIPSVQPKPKTGHWIDHQEDKWIYAQCSECETVHDTRTNYCPNCGCRMVEPQESEGKE